MARSDEEKLVLALEARITDFEKGLERARKTTNDKFRKMTESAQKNSTAMQKAMQGASAGVNMALAKIGIGGLGFASITAAVNKAMQSIIALGDEAKTAGLEVQNFQKWRYVADQNRIGVDALVDSFRELNIRANEYAEKGEGSAAEAFAKLGMSPAEVKERLKNPSDLLLEIIDRTKRLKDTAASVRVFDELLGGQGGETMVRLIDQGREGITATLKEAEKMGGIMDENFIKRAEEVDRKFSQIATTIGSTLKAAIVDAVGALSAFISSWNDLNEKSVSGIKAELELLRQAKERLETTQPAGGFEDTIAGFFGQDRESQLARITQREKEFNNELERRKNLNVPVVPDAAPVTPYKLPDKSSGGKSSADRERDKAAKAAERERKAVTDLIKELEFEASLVGKTALQKEQMIAVRHAGAGATAKEKAEIEALVESTYRANEAHDKQRAALEELNDAGRDFAGTLVSGMLDGAKASEVLANALKNLADRFLNSGLDALFNGGGGGGFGGLLGGLFGGGGKSDPWAGLRLPGFANGTNSAPGGLSIVGERGPELLNIPRGSQVVSNANIARALKQPAGQVSSGAQGQSSEVKVDVGVSVDNNGNLQAYVENVAKTAATSSARREIKTFANSNQFPQLVSGALKIGHGRGMTK